MCIVVILFLEMTIKSIFYKFILEISLLIKIELNYGPSFFLFCNAGNQSSTT